jgi:precorrin-6B C5,15-methyltransferase / cobalt-precorrin-6B C5,C15-methyltransferase
MEQQICVIGIGDNGPEGLPGGDLERIRACEVLVGGERQLAFFPEHTGIRLVLKSGIAAVMKEIKSLNRNTVILASGDPLFYGIGGYAAKQLQAEIRPGVSSVQLAFARMGENWQNACVISIHGRSMKGLAQRIDGQELVALLTDGENDPAAVGRYLLAFGMKEYLAFVAENLGGKEERTGWYELDKLSSSAFSPLNVVVLKRTEPSPVWTTGIDDEEFQQRKPDKGLLTKREVRILSLAELKLQKNSVVWDIGTCTGSMAIEAARIAKEGQVYAIEKNELDLENCRLNMARFRADITAVQGKAPGGLEAFPDPDAVFIGGTGGELREILRTVCSRLKPNGRIVLNAIALETVHDAQEAFRQEGYRAEMTLAQISRSKPILHLTRLEGLNPVFIITAKRTEGVEKTVE